LNALESVRKGEATIQDYAEYVRKTVADIRELMGLINVGGDDSRHLRNIWEQMLVNPLLAKPEAKFTAQEQLHYLDMLGEQIRRIIYRVGFLTIPSRLNDWLRLTRPGYYIPFHLVFEDEVPNGEDRTRILNYLAWSPEELKGGIVDAANGLIYRYADKLGSRLLSLLYIALALVASTGVVAGACYISVEGWPIGVRHLPAFLVSWVAVLAGVATHVGVGSVKRSRAQGGLPPVVALGDFTMIADARMGEIFRKLFLALVGFFGLAFGGGVGQVTPFNAFLLGYSLDSFVELFGSTLEQRASAQVATLRKQLGPPG
jgi:hypothetical protein